MTAPLLALLGLLAGAETGRTATAVFAGGCFWGVESVFEHVRGVVRATAGYAGGTVPRPTYELVGTGTTGHAEAVEVEYDPAVVSYRELLEVFFRVAHDPTSRDRQGPDEGPEYRAMVFVATPEERAIVDQYLRELETSHAFRAPIVTEVRPRTAFYVAEAYHQDYAERHPDEPYIVSNDAPKVARLEALFPKLYREP